MKSFIPYGRQCIEADDIRAVTQCLKSNYLTQGPLVAKFEKALCKKTGARFTLAVSNGTAALHLLALALNLKPGDEVITTPSFLATANCLLYAGLKPVFADVDPESGNLTAATIQKKITRKTKAIFLTHLAGNPCDLVPISKLAKKKKIFLIEDAAHALGARYNNHPVGNCRYSDAVIFSFHPVKHITTGEGGAVLTNNPKIADRVALLRNHGVTRDPKKLRSNPGRWHYEMQELGFNYRLTDMQAALGLSQLRKLDRFINARRKIAVQYRQLLRNVSGVGLPHEQGKSRHAYHLFAIKLLTPKLTNARKKIFDDMFAAGVGVQAHYILIPSQPYYRGLGFQAEKLHGAQAYFKSTMSLPIFPGLKEKHVKRVADTVKKVIKKYA